MGNKMYRLHRFVERSCGECGNFFADTAIEPVVELSRPYQSVNFFNCSGRLENDRVYLCDIAPFAFAGFELFE
jgi:hypothetical protein